MQNRRNSTAMIGGGSRERESRSGSLAGFVGGPLRRLYRDSLSPLWRLPEPLLLPGIAPPSAWGIMMAIATILGMHTRWN